MLNTDSPAKIAGMTTSRKTTRGKPEEPRPPGRPRELPFQHGTDQERRVTIRLARADVEQIEALAGKDGTVAGWLRDLVARELGKRRR